MLTDHATVYLIHGAGTVATVFGEQELDYLGDFVWSGPPVEDALIRQLKAELRVYFLHQWGLDEAAVGDY